MQHDGFADSLLLAGTGVVFVQPIVKINVDFLAKAV
jgi:hypothetical protein